MNIPRLSIPILVIVALFGGYGLRLLFTQPTTQVLFAAEGRKSVVCVVDGLKCKGTANFFTNLYRNVPGIASIETYATEHKAVFQYDPALISPENIRTVMEAPIPLRDGSTRQVFTCQSLN